MCFFTKKMDRKKFLLLKDNISTNRDVSGSSKKVRWICAKKETEKENTFYIL